MPFVGWLDSRVGKDDVGVGACEGVVCTEAGVEASYTENISTCLILWPSTCLQHTLKKLLELRLNILSTSLIGAFRRVAVPAPPVVVVVAAPLM